MMTENGEHINIHTDEVDDDDEEENREKWKKK